MKFWEKQCKRAEEKKITHWISMLKVQGSDAAVADPQMAKDVKAKNYTQLTLRVKQDMSKRLNRKKIHQEKYKNDARG